MRKSKKVSRNKFVALTFIFYSFRRQLTNYVFNR